MLRISEMAFFLKGPSVRPLVLPITDIDTLDAGLLALVSIRKVLRPATSTQVFLRFLVSKSKC